MNALQNKLHKHVAHFSWLKVVKHTANKFDGVLLTSEVNGMQEFDCLARGVWSGVASFHSCLAGKRTFEAGVVCV